MKLSERVLSWSTSNSYRWRRHLHSRGRRLLLQFGLPWGTALLVGLIAVLYARWSDQAYAQFMRLQAPHPWLPLLLTPACAMLGVWLTRRWFSGSEGSGIPQVIAALHAPNDPSLMRRLFGLRVVVGKLGISLLGLLGGMSLGREGPTVHIGAAVMAETRRFYPHQSPQLQRQLLLAGAAAGLSAAFNTPLAGVIFAIEELARDFQSRTNSTMLTAVVFAGLTSLALAGNYLYFGQLSVQAELTPALLLPVLAAAALCTLVGAAFNWTLLQRQRWMPAPLLRWRSQRPLLYGLLLGLAIAALGIASGGLTWGSGYAQARQLLAGDPAIGAAFAPLKWLAMVLSYMVGIAGGLFSPSLAIGAGLAQWLHLLFHATPLPLLIALCMTGYLAAITQSPLTSFIIVMEMTNGSAMVLPLMATALLAARLAGLLVPPLYDALAHANYAPRKAVARP